MLMVNFHLVTDVKNWYHAIHIFHLGLHIYTFTIGEIV